MVVLQYVFEDVGQDLHFEEIVYYNKDKQIFYFHHFQLFPLQGHLHFRFQVHLKDKYAVV